MREAHGGDGDAIRPGLAHPPQLKIILSSSSEGASMVPARSAAELSQKLHPPGRIMSTEFYER